MTQKLNQRTLDSHVSLSYANNHNHERWSNLLGRGCHCLNPESAATAAKSIQSCPTLCDPIDGSPPGSPVPGILQARTLEWVAISFSSAWKWKLKVKVAQSCPTQRPHDCSPPGSSVHGIFQARVLEWVAIAFSGIQSLGCLKSCPVTGADILAQPAPCAPKISKSIPEGKTPSENCILENVSLKFYRSAKLATRPISGTHMLWMSTSSSWRVDSQISLPGRMKQTLFSFF